MLTYYEWSFRVDLMLRESSKEDSIGELEKWSSKEGNEWQKMLKKIIWEFLE